MEKKYNKVVLAYSGGLDTSVLIPWLKEHYGCEVIAVSGNVGQGTELDGLEEKALKTGASKLYIEDLTKDFVDDYIIPTMKAGATYEQYLLGTSFARPIIAKRIVDIALKEGADAICHGCTGKGNDQVRFELAIHAFAPQMDIIAPWRFWELNSREKEIEYAGSTQHSAEDQQETNYRIRICGTSAMRVWTSSCRPTKHRSTSRASSSWAFPRKWLRTSRPMLPFISRRAFRPQLTARSSSLLP